MVADIFPQARHVKAFHNLGVEMILDHARHQLVAFIASDDVDAANIVMQLAREALLTPLLTGGFNTASLSEFPGPLFGIPFTTVEEAREALKKSIGWN
jgi:predicted dinucleotide-binding enzyme